MKTLYKKIIEKLKDPKVLKAFAVAGISRVKHVDLYKGQYFRPKDFEVMQFPAVLFEWGINYSQTVNEGKHPATISLHLIYEQVRDTSSVSRNQDEALKFFDFIEQVYNVVEGIESENTGKLQIIDEGVVEEDTMATVYKLTFTCNYSGRSRSAMNNYVESPGDADFEISESELKERFKTL